MNVSEIKHILNISSSQKVIFEENIDNEIAGRNICSLLNSGGGFAIFEIADQDRYKFLSIETEIQALERTLSKDIVPKALFSLEIREVEGSHYLIIEIPNGKDSPYAYMDRIYVEKRNRRVKADIETIKDMVLRKQNEPIRWERRFSDADFNTDFDQDHYGSVLGNMTKANRFVFTEEKNQELYSYLDDLSVYKYGKFTNAGDVVFCKNPARRYPQIRAKAVLLRSDKTDSEFLDFKYFEGPLLIIYKELSNFIARNTPTAAYFPQNDPRRQNKQLYPERAIREGLINALVHRNYSYSGGSISVSIYPDRLEIWNYGEFPEGVTVRSLDKGNVSVLRNPDIAHVLYLQDYMEKLGRGAKSIKKECSDYGLPEPEWKSEKGKGVTLTFFAPTDDILKRTKQGLGWDQARTKQGLSPDELKILEFCRNEDRALTDIMALFSRTNKTKFKKTYINPLLEYELIVLAIPDVPTSPKQKYRLTELGENEINRI